MFLYIQNTPWNVVVKFGNRNRVNTLVSSLIWNVVQVLDRESRHVEMRHPFNLFNLRVQIDSGRDMIKTAWNHIRTLQIILSPSHWLILAPCVFEPIYHTYTISQQAKPWNNLVTYILLFHCSINDTMQMFLIWQNIIYTFLVNHIILKARNETCAYTTYRANLLE